MAWDPVAQAVEQLWLGPINPCAILTINMVRKYKMLSVRPNSVVDLQHFGTGSDPGIRIGDLRIRIRDKIRILLRILLFSSMTFKMLTKNNFFSLRFLLITF
jgi:hypothetical protein